MSAKNLDPHTVDGFGEEWSHFDQKQLSSNEFHEISHRYFHIFPWHKLSKNAIGFDLGCGSGRFAKYVAPRVYKLYCIDASDKALSVAKENLHNQLNCEFLHASVDEIPLTKNSLDFGYSLGVLHHVPNTQEGINKCVELLKPGAPFLLYLYYALDNRPIWFKWIWFLSDQFRKIIARLPFIVRKFCTDLLALLIYWPLAKTSLILEKIGFNVNHFPLSAYRHNSYYTMRTDALDRFGTKLEQRFSKDEIKDMMYLAGLKNIEFSQNIPYWVAIGFKN
ncbi:MAG: class I SAM-dependent methyltransferase [Bdellovibrionales bacterium]|nr:class I SAM-dependent methyltransferase [Bdellovibrionales bacterium]